MNKRIIYVFLGNIGIGISVAMCMFANFGTDPFNTFARGVNNILNIGLGTTLVIINIFLFVIMFIFDKKNIGLGTLLNCFGVGYVTEYFYYFLNYLDNSPSLIIRIVLLIIGIVGVCASVGLYMACEYGNAPWDDLGIIITERNPKITYKTPRLIQDITAVIIGYTLSATVGIATLLLAFCLGPLINLSTDYFKKKLIN